MIITYAANFATACFALALLMNLTHLLRTDTVADRILAVDTMVVNMIALIVLNGVVTGSEMNFEAAILFSMIGFVSSTALCRYLLRGSIIE